MCIQKGDCSLISVVEIMNKFRHNINWTLLQITADFSQGVW